MDKKQRLDELKKEQASLIEAGVAVFTGQHPQKDNAKPFFDRLKEIAKEIAYIEDNVSADISGQVAAGVPFEDAARGSLANKHQHLKHLTQRIDMPNGLVNGYQNISGVIVELAEPAPEASLLNRCRTKQENNQNYIDEIGNRLVVLLERLRGSSNQGKLGESADDDDKKSPGILVDFCDDLNWEARRLGEVMNDLTLLESLL